MGRYMITMANTEKSMEVAQKEECTTSMWSAILVVSICTKKENDVSL